jgi:hypothetical protein
VVEITRNRLIRTSKTKEELNQRKAEKNKNKIIMQEEELELAVEVQVWTETLLVNQMKNVQNLLVIYLQL